MASLILPRRFTQQPQYPVEKDVNNPLSSGLTNIYLPTSRDKPIVLSGNASIAPSPSGMAYSTGANGIVNIQDSSSWTFPDTQRLTMAFVGRINSVDNPWGGLFVKRKAANNTYGPMVQRDSSNDRFRIYNGTNFDTWNNLAISSITQKDIVFIVTLSAASGVTTAKAFIAGVEVDSITIGAWISTDSAGNFLIGSEHTANTIYGANVDCSLFSVWNGKVLNNYEIAEFSHNPWQIFKRRPQVLYFDVGGTTGVTGTGAATTGNTTASGTGTLTHKGTGALTTSSVTASGTGTITHVGTGALTTSNTTVEGTGTIIGVVTGSGALTVGTVTASGAGTLTHKGTGSLTASAITVDGTGTVSAAGVITGSGAITVAAATVAGTGTISHTGTGALSASPIVLAGAGVITHTGNGDLTTGATTASGTGLVIGTITGTGAITINAVQVSGGNVVAVEQRGGGGKSGRSKRQKLILVEHVEDFDDLIEQVEEIVKAEPKTKKKVTKLQKPLQKVETAPEAVIDWLDYYRKQLEALRDQQRAESLKRQIDTNEQLIRALLAKQQQNAIIEQEMLQMQREDEEMMLLLMAA